MGIFDGVLICTDLDGTLLKNDKTISDENKEAIAYFQKEGGLFTFITGRMPHYVGNICDEVHPNAPYGCVNGGGIYDHRREEYLWTMELPRESLELVRAVREQMPQLGIQVITFHQSYFLNDTDIMRWFRKLTGLPYITCNPEDITEPIAKILFSFEEDELPGLQAILDTHPLASQFQFIRSQKELYEILPKQSGKGAVITKLSELLGLDIQKTVAIGDYDNDVSMLLAARLGVAVENACQKALDAADLVTVSNEQHAIAQVIHDLAEGKIVL